MRYQHANGRENAKETIYRYLSPELASRDFSDFVEDEFVTWPDQQSWQVPPGISFENAEAENIYVACRSEAVGEECQFAAQYQEFVVVISILTESPNIDLLLSLFEEIDNRMASFLSS